ncbi:MAG: hypothetical protein A4E47_00737 [Methanosaeta sp. PtaU1.Bin028]|nr:MAG: hypothetical protein A4E47_00737 [Methanosaeta sp. PtaU1.Bin028]
MPHICSICNKSIDEGTDLFLGCPACGGKKFHFVRPASGRSQKDQNGWDQLPGEEAVITREMGVRVPPRRSAPTSATRNSDHEIAFGQVSPSTTLAQERLPGKRKEPSGLPPADRGDRLAEPDYHAAQSTAALQAVQTSEKRLADASRIERAAVKEAGAVRELDPVESIRINEPGTYELNLPYLFNRDGLIMAVKEGTYLIDLSTAFRRSKKPP